MNYFLKKILNFWKIFDVLKEIQPSRNNYNEIELKIEDTQNYAINICYINMN